MASASPSIAEHRNQPLPQDFGDELLEEIFFRLPTPAALARASTACPRFRGIITERSFLRRFSKRHPPPLLGLVDDKGGFQPAQAPHPSAPLARALADAADFTYSFVPKPSDGSSWYPRDVRDGRVLLEGSASGEIITNLAVCDPLSRRYVLLPPIPMDLALAVEEKSRGFKPLLAPTGEADDVTTFKVICLADYQPKLVAFVFSSVTGKWCIAASTSWGSLGSRPQAWQNSRLNEYCGLSCFDYVCGCFTCFSASIWKYKLLVLDTRKMEFHTVNDHTGYHMKLRCLPDHHDGNVMPCQRRPGQSRSLSHIVVGREGALEMFALVGPNGMFDLYHTIQKNNGQSSNEWHLENIIPLPGNGKYDYFTVGAAEGFLFLGATTEDQLDIDEGAAVRLPRTDWDVDYFALDVKTSELTHVCRKKRQYFHQEDVHCYFGFPPSLSKPSI